AWSPPEQTLDKRSMPQSACWADLTMHHACIWGHRQALWLLLLCKARIRTFRPGDIGHVGRLGEHLAAASFVYFGSCSASVKLPFEVIGPVFEIDDRVLFGASGSSGSLERPSGRRWLGVLLHLGPGP